MEKATTELSVVETRSVALELTEEAIQTIQHNIQMAERLVMTVLEKDIDYGIHPGTNSFALRDPGASKIINAFNCYPDHKILSSQENEDMISFQIQANLISRQTGKVVGTGVGAASTMESKYGFRWVENPEDYGFKREELTRRRKGKYRIPNPEISDLGNTIFKMSTKRAEVDACQSLPGVGSALRKLFGEPEAKSEKPEYEGPVWQRFWGEVRRLGMTDQEAHTKLRVVSMKDWLGKGRSLDEALDILRGKEPAQEEPTRASTKPKVKRDPETIKTINELYHACNEDFTVIDEDGKPRKMQPKEVLKELGYSSQEDIADTPANCYRAISAVRTE